MSSKNGCDICHGSDDCLDHKNSLRHRFNFALLEWNRYRRAIVKNRNGVEVKAKLYNIATDRKDLTFQFDEKKGRHEIMVTEHRAAFEMQQNNGITYIFTVINKQRFKKIFLLNTMLLHSKTTFKLHDFEGKMEENVILQLEPSASYSFKVTFFLKSTSIGVYHMPVAIHLQSDQKDNFTISRDMRINILGSFEFNQEVAAPKKSPFTSTLWNEEIKDFREPSVRIPFQNTYTIPTKFDKIIKMGVREFYTITPTETVQLRKIQSTLEPGFVTKHNYMDFFHTSLWCDEMGAMLMLQRYNMENVVVKVIQTKLLELEVPGLAEKRPSLIKGDVVLIRLHNDHIAYKGIIKTVNNLTIWIQGVDQEFIQFVKEEPNTEVDVSFQLGRLPYERMHSGVDQCVKSGLLDYLFPENIIVKPSAALTFRLPDAEFINKSICKNPEQRSAVEHIVFKKHNAAPYIVFGPPGTGKTITIVEAILQLVKRNPNVVILVCAPANAACDMLASKLVQSKRLSSKELVRVHTDTREWDTVPTEIKEFSNYEAGQYIKLKGFELMKYRVIVTTLILSGRYYNYGFKPNYLFIDEAAQAMEPEVGVAIGLLSPGSHVILAGDPKQLGPICSSKVAEKYELHVSMLERLMKMPLYLGNNMNFITTLKLNFRAHPEVLKIPNDVFYDSQLHAMSQSALTDPIANICIYDKFNPRRVRNSPASCLEFCAVFAKEMRQGRSPSYFNPKEAEMVLKYVTTLLNLRETEVVQTDIGIITPYIRQVYRVKELLTKQNFSDVEVGTTEVFQGREKRIIIITTVRAQYDLLLYDRKYKLGFVSNGKRFNVALTRAMSKLIIIGCPNVLQYDENWLKLIEYCEGKRTYFGGNRDIRDDKLKQDVMRRLNNIYLRDEQHKRAK